jgi:hypothetical protein
MAIKSINVGRGFYTCGFLIVFNFNIVKSKLFILLESPRPELYLESFIGIWAIGI